MAKLKLTPQLQDQIGNNITLGMPLKFAAESFLSKWAGYKAKYSLELVTAGFKMVRE